MKKIILISVLSAFIALLSGYQNGIENTTYYVNAGKGNDSNSGTSEKEAFKTLAKISTLNLKAGDKILLAAGETFRGTLILKNISGDSLQPVQISAYGKTDNHENRPLIDAKGFMNGIELENCSFVEIKNINITANGGNNTGIEPSNKNMRCGILVKTTKVGNYSNIHISDINIKDIFYENKGFSRPKGEVKTANGTQNYGWGIRFINNTKGAKISNLSITGCRVENVAHTGIKLTSGNNKYGITDFSIENCTVLKTGGPGIQMSRVANGIIRNCVVDFSGSVDDSRKWGRGSGLWTWSADNIIIEHNKFMNANGPGDSAGCHIDFNCSNVVVQYNLSMNNAGGFCEILGNNYNCAYRYNVSVNDGHRVKGENGAFQEGKIFWLSGYNGNKKRKGPFNSYFYNNTIYVKKDIVAKIAITKSAKGVLIANNIFYIEGISKAVKGDQYNPEKAGEIEIENVVFKNNLYLNETNWPDDVLISDSSPIFGNPEFENAGGTEISDYTPTNILSIKNKGIEITKIPNDKNGLKIGLKTETCILGKSIEGLPDIGAISIKAIE